MRKIHIHTKLDFFITWTQGSQKIFGLTFIWEANFQALFLNFSKTKANTSLAASFGEED